MWTELVYSHESRDPLRANRSRAHCHMWSGRLLRQPPEQVHPALRGSVVRHGSAAQRASESQESALIAGARVEAGVPCTRQVRTWSHLSPLQNNSIYSDSITKYNLGSDLDQILRLCCKRVDTFDPKFSTILIKLVQAIQHISPYPQTALNIKLKYYILAQSSDMEQSEVDNNPPPSIDPPLLIYFFPIIMSL